MSYVDPTDPRGWHQCHFCGADVDKDGMETDGHGHLKRHFLSDCRPDLVQHEPGELCTWPFIAERNQYREPGCYAFQDRDTNEWGAEHIHFYPDGAM